MSRGTAMGSWSQRPSARARCAAASASRARASARLRSAAASRQAGRRARLHGLADGAQRVARAGQETGAHREVQGQAVGRLVDLDQRGAVRKGRPGLEPHFLEEAAADEQDDVGAVERLAQAGRLHRRAHAGARDARSGKSIW